MTSVIVVQMGARHGYLLPNSLCEAGMLEALYTDVYARSPLASIASSLTGIPLSSGLRSKLNSLSRRKPSPAVAARTVSFEAIAIVHELWSRLSRSAVGRESASRWRDRALGRAMIEEGYGRATHILACLGEGNSFLAEARRRGLAIVSDMTIALSSDAIVAKEAEQFPSWSDAPHWKMIRDNDILLSCTSLFLCPSDFVQRDLVENFSVDVKKTCVLPYHVPAAFFGVKSAPQVGRILFAGTADLRKGIHYLAMAADILRSRGRRYDFRVAGNASAAVRSQEIARNLRFLGRLPRDQVRAEFEAADVLVLPTLAEGSAGVTYEALGAGIPVITTAAAGSIVRDGRDGFIVAERDPVALADRVEELVEDRALRERMGAAARLHASQYTASNYSKRLIEAVVATKGSAPC